MFNDAYGKIGKTFYTYRQILNIPDTTMSVSLFKNKLKKFLTEKQILGDDINWIEHNYYPF